MYEIMCNPEYDDAIGRSSGKIKPFIEMIANLTQKIDNISVVELIDEIIYKTGYVEALLAENPQEAAGRIENIDELKSKAAEYEENVEEHSFGGFLDNISLVSDIDNYDDEQDAVVLMTLHSAKGLEFPVVFMCGMEYGLFPSLMSEMEEGGKEEERRLCYVGITRAKKVLYLTSARSRTMYGKTETRMPSPFIDEIPKNLMDGESEIALRPKKTFTSPISDGAGVYSKIPSFNLGGSKPKKTSAESIINRFNMSSAANIAQSAQPCGIKKGDRVKHKKFGEGLVVNAVDKDGDTQLEVCFDNVGTRTLMASFARLTKI